MTEDKKILATPKVRKFARELGANVSDIKGTERKGRITEDDVKNFIKLSDDKFSEKIKEIFQGKDNDFSTAVCLNAAAGLIVSEKFTDFKSAYNHSKEFILSGKTLDHLKNIQNV